MDKSSFEAEITLRYAAVRDVIADKGRIAVLHIGHEQTDVAVGDGLDSLSTLTLAIGSHRTAREHFKHASPSPLELENAIVTVEDEVTRARVLWMTECTLYTTDTAIGEIATISGVAESARMQLPIEAMERTFDRLTSVALGRPASHEGLPSSNAFAATLLILREFMHHLQFKSITVLKQNYSE